MKNMRILIIMTLFFSIISIGIINTEAQNLTRFYLMSPDSGTTKVLTTSAVDTTGSLSQGVPTSDWINYTSESMTSGSYIDDYYHYAIFFRNTSNDHQVNISLFFIHSDGTETKITSWLRSITTGAFTNYTDTATALDEVIQDGDRFRLSIKVPGPSGVLMAYNSTLYPSFISFSFENIVFPEFNSLLPAGILIGVLVIITSRSLLKKRH